MEGRHLILPSLVQEKTHTADQHFASKIIKFINISQKKTKNIQQQHLKDAPWLWLVDCI
jgi:hypothetical protein